MMKFPLKRLVIICFWIALIFAGLFWPKFKILHFEENSISIFAWGDILDPSAIQQFEKETGIKVHLNFYSSNEELLAKLKATKAVGYDLVIPSDYAVALLQKENLLKKIDKSKLSFWKYINPRLIHHEFDPDNSYSIPFEWELFGFGVDKDFFKDKPLDHSWKLIFAPQIPYKIGMINDPIEALQFAGFYLYGPISSLDEAQTEGVKNLLIRQKKWVEAYAEFRADYFLATRNCPVVVASSSYIWRTMRLFPFVGFIVPKEGSFITIENLAIPIASEKEKQVYEFINFIYRPEIVALHYKTYGFFPATLNALHLMDPDPQAKALIYSTEEDFKKFHFNETVLPEQEMRDLWVEIKSAN